MSELQVIAEDLDSKAAALQAAPISSITDGVKVAPPCGLQAARVAAENLNRNAELLSQYQNWAKIEKDRLAQSLTAASTAYTRVDTLYEAALNGGQPSGPISVTPDTPPAAPAPQSNVPRMASASSEGASSVLQTEADLNQPDQGLSLNTAYAAWTSNAVSLTLASETMHLDGLTWHSPAADAAREKFRQFGQWLGALGASWSQLAQQAQQIYDVHSRLRVQHEDIARRYAEAKLKAEWAMRNMDQQMASIWYAEMHRMQELSDQLRADYGSQTRVTPVNPPAPPASSSEQIPVTAPGREGGNKPSEDPTKSGGGAPSAGSGGSGGGSGSPKETGRPTGSEQPVAPQPADSPPQTSPQSQTPSQGSSPSSGGGSPSSGGGGMPSGLPGGLGGGAPKDLPKPPKDTELKPAALGGGGAGGGAGGGGGGMPKMPLSPSVSAETVAPAAAGPAASALPGAAAHPTGSGAMGGGMPMGGHGAGQGQGKEKKRSTTLSPDEQLYKEDRDWTEAVIGNRRRKDVQEGRESK